MSAPLVTKQLKHNNFSDVQTQVLNTKINSVNDKSEQNESNIAQNTTDITNLRSQVTSLNQLVQNENIQNLIKGEFEQKDYDSDIDGLQAQINNKVSNSTLNSKIDTLTSKITSEIEKFEEKIKNKFVPSGAIMFFDKTACPDGWTSLASIYPSASGAFMRNMGESNRKLGSYQAGAVPDIELAVRLDDSEDMDKYYTERLDEYGPDDWGGSMNYDTGYSDEYLYVMSSADKKYRAADLLKSAPDVYDKDVKEVRPNNIAFLACRKN